MKKPTRVERKRRRRVVFFRLVLLLTLIVISISYAFKADFFTIGLINIEGNNVLANNLIVNASKINLGENIFRIKTSDSKNEIELLPYIKNVRIKRKLPDTINITVEERVAVVQIKTLANYVLIDNEGFILEIIDNRVDNLPCFIGFDIKDIKPGTNINHYDLGLKLLEFVNEEDILGILKKVDTLTYDSEEINIKLIDGISVAFGPLFNVKYKLRLLDKILIDIEKKQIACSLIIMNKGENPILVTDN